MVNFLLIAQVMQILINLNMNFDVGNAELSGTISSVEESFDNFNLEMIFDSTISENIPWYVAILGGFLLLPVLLLLQKFLKKV